jgi:hypothetical protein
MTFFWDVKPYSLATMLSEEHPATIFKVDVRIETGDS